MMFDGWNPHFFGVSFMEIQMFFYFILWYLYGYMMGYTIYIYICISIQLEMVWM